VARFACRRHRAAAGGWFPLKIGAPGLNEGWRFRCKRTADAWLLRAERPESRPKANVGHELGAVKELGCIQFAICNSYFAICNGWRFRLQIAKQELQIEK
jgi:hypothetical protein